MRNCSRRYTSFSGDNTQLSLLQPYVKVIFVNHAIKVITPKTNHKLAREDYQLAAMVKIAMFNLNSLNSRLSKFPIDRLNRTNSVNKPNNKNENKHV